MSMGLEYFEKMFTSQVAIFICLALEILYQRMVIRNKDSQIKELYEKTIHLLELRNAVDRQNKDRSD